MPRKVVRTIATGLLTLFLVTVLVFLLIHLAPGTPLAGTEDAGGPTTIPPDVLTELRRVYHLDEPLYRQYALWLGGALRGDLGRSLHDKRPVSEKIGERIGITLAVNGGALFCMLLLAVPVGALAAWKPGSVVDRSSSVVGYMLYAVPLFWAALLLQMAFAVRLDWLPLAGLQSDGWDTLGPVARFADRLRHLVLPVACLAYPGLAYLSRFVRATLLENATAETALAARARGLSSLGVLVRHGFRQAAVPMLTLAGLLLPALVSGSVIVEHIFAIPGLGSLFVDAAFQRDITVLMALTLLSGIATLAGVLAADLAYAVFDPRVRRGTE